MIKVFISSFVVSVQLQTLDSGLQIMIQHNISLSVQVSIAQLLRNVDSLLKRVEVGMLLDTVNC